MGADGGVCWVELANGKSVSDFVTLFEPWVVSLLSIDGGQSRSDDTRWDFANSNPTVCGNPHGSFGTDVCNRPSLMDLDGISDFIKECIDDGCETWRDILLELRTRPSWVCELRGQDLFLDWMQWASIFTVVPKKDRRNRWETYGEAFMRTLRETDNETLELNDFWDQSLEEWMQRLSKTVKGSWADNTFYVHVDYEETWT